MARPPGGAGCYAGGVWASVHKVDRVRPQPGGGAIILVEDERSAGVMQLLPPLSVLIAVARVLDARQVLAARYADKGEVRYATNASLPGFLFDAVVRAGAAVSDRSGEHLVSPAQPASVAAVIDAAFSDLAYAARTELGVSELRTALQRVEAARRKAPLDRDREPARYWRAVFELAALAGELARGQGGRWIDVREMPVPFALRVASGQLAMPTRLAQRIVAGEATDETMAAP